MALFGPKTALMDFDAPRCRVVWLRVSIGNFLFVYPGQSVRIIIVCVRVKLPEKRRNMVVELRVSRFPSKRHYDMLVDKGRIRYDSGFLVCALIERNR